MIDGYNPQDFSFLTAVRVSTTSEAVCQAVELATTMLANGDDACPVPAYTNNNVSTKVIKLIQSYVGIVNKIVWSKFIDKYAYRSENAGLPFATSESKPKITPSL